ncbi:hypothetical protein MLD38_035698 [Melastoma candidum]|uniref:Uncharacterized protein n=1 Tax=Melastoma candidum TaxID=119954 RepID=A0ACB9LHM0_9MYRT|nr:hypothetical protein MLD38_035698 [Melastoma candidum]
MEQQDHRRRPHHHKNSSPQPPRWWTKETVAIVTGANKGIGFSLVRKLACLGVTVILTCRNVERGTEAVKVLREEGIHVRFRRLDILDPSSIESFVAWFGHSLGALDILVSSSSSPLRYGNMLSKMRVNNAAVSFNEVNGNSVDRAETVINTNYRGTKRLTQALLPFFRRSSTVSRILNISSRLGHVNKVKNPKFTALLRGESLLESEVDAMVTSFLSDVKEGTWRVKGWPEVWTDYAVSKLALNSYSKILAKRNAGFGLSVNCYCPGFTQTSMTGGVGKRTADEAAATTAMLVLLPPEELPTGVFFAGCDPVINSRERPGVNSTDRLRGREKSINILCRVMAGSFAYRSLAPKTKNLVVAGGLSAFVLGVYFYTMRAVGGTDELQSAIDKFEEQRNK